MKEGLKKPLRAFVLLSFIQLALTLFVGTALWAIFKHDTASLDQSFFQDVRSELFAQLMGGLVALIALINVLMMVKHALGGGERMSYKRVAFAGLIMSAIVASPFFLPVRFTVYGLGGIAALFIAFKALGVLWKGVSWPFRKLFSRKPKDGAAPKTADAPKPKASKSP